MPRVTALGPDDVPRRVRVNGGGKKYHTTDCQYVSPDSDTTTKEATLLDESVSWVSGSDGPFGTTYRVGVVAFAGRQLKAALECEDCMAARGPTGRTTLPVDPTGDNR